MTQSKYLISVFFVLILFFFELQIYKVKHTHNENLKKNSEKQIK